MERLAATLADPRDRNAATDAIHGLIERIALTPGGKRSEVYAALRGDLSTMLEWAGSGGQNSSDRHPASRNVDLGGRGGSLRPRLTSIDDIGLNRCNRRSCWKVCDRDAVFA